jgi:F420-dependent oxidoreductase-like protein
MKIGLQTVPQDCEYSELRRAWQTAENSGIQWISVCDHFYSTHTEYQGPSLEGVAICAGLAVETSRARIGNLVFCMAYRNPAILAKVAVTINQISNGRLELGLGCGWNRPEFVGYGIPYLKIGERLTQLEEGIQVIQSLLSNDITNFHGKFYHLENAYCEPKPVKTKIPIWIGGGGERRLLRLVARYADSWNLAYKGPAEYQRKNEILTTWCEMENRDPKSVARTATVILNLALRDADIESKDTRAREQFGKFYARLDDGFLNGTAPKVADRIRQYERAGVEMLIISLRPPIDWESYHAFLEEVLPAFS